MSCTASPLRGSPPRMRTVSDSLEVGATKRVPIRKLDKTGRRMTWIEDGCIVVDGRRVFRRDLYAWHYRSSTAFKERTAADMENLGLTRLRQGGTLEPNRVIKGLEAREAKKDIVPCKEYFDRIDAMMERKKSEDFDYWYISDEPECRGVSAIYLRHIYEYMKERDPYHVILTSSRRTPTSGHTTTGAATAAMRGL